MCYQLSTLKRSKTIELHAVTGKLNSKRNMSRSFHYDALSTFHNNTKCMRFRFDPLSKTFLNRYVFDLNVQRISVVWTEGLNASKCMRFQTKTH